MSAQLLMEANADGEIFSLKRSEAEASLKLLRSQLGEDGHVLQHIFNPHLTAVVIADIIAKQGNQ
jgi:hypothetical protein